MDRSLYEQLDRIEAKIDAFIEALSEDDVEQEGEQEEVEMTLGGSQDE